MREVFEFRVESDFAHLLFCDDEGVDLGSVRKVRLASDDPRLPEVGRLEVEMRRHEGRPFFFGWRIDRYYTKRELDRAELLHLHRMPTFEPEGESCGTVYDESTACPSCGVGRTRTTDLVLDLRKVPSGADIAVTIAGERIVSQRLADLLIESGTTGIELRAVVHKAYFGDDPVDPRKLEAGRELIRLAKRDGFPYPTWRFYVWLNRGSQRELQDRMQAEYEEAAGKRQRRRRPPPPWYELVPTSRRPRTTPPTAFGVEPLDLDTKGEFRCPLGHTSGLNLLSEIWIDRADWDGSDVVETEDHAGIKRGVLVPERMLLVSRRLHKLLLEWKVRRCRFEVVRFTQAELSTNAT